jgi:uncharacterized protein involved in exopolysaccharide biosynthesis
MQRKLIAMAIMALPVMAHAGSDSSAALLQKLEALEQQVKALQQSNAQIPLLQQQVQNLQQQLGSNNTAAIQAMRQQQTKARSRKPCSKPSTASRSRWTR